MLNPLRNFAHLEGSHLYRSAQPIYDYEFRFIKKELGITHILNLRSEINIDRKFAHKYGIHAHTISVADHHPPMLHQALSFIHFISFVRTPILFHCEHGRGRTSTFAVIARIGFNGWSLERSLKEEKDVFGYDFQHPVQLEWLKNFEKSLKKHRYGS